MKFIHLADVHLGAVPDKGHEWSSRREEEIWDTFRRVIARIRENPVDLLFIAGDLFHRQPLLHELKAVNDLFSTIPETRIYLVAGDHDHMRKVSNYHSFVWAENVYLFKEEEFNMMKDPYLPVYVYGYSYHHPEIRFSMLQGCRPEKEEGYHILLAHGGDEKHVPWDTAALMRAGYDYLALGHAHQPAVLVRDRAAMAGALEPFDKNDLGPHGYMEGDTESGRLRVQFVPFSYRTYEQVMISITPETTQEDLEEKMRQFVEQYGEKGIFRVILQGQRAPGVLLIPEKLKKIATVLEIVDESYPYYDLEELEKKYRNTLIGDYILYFRQKERTHVEEKALYSGLQALLATSR
ncbi:MAG: DNA repair exonuclease [Eubacteriales bacterium]|nr:DNA repair exonuclease [Eubacteriales bacterium]